MGHSKLETNIAILKILALNGPINKNEVASKLNATSDQMKTNITFLHKQGLIEYKTNNKKNTYLVTSRGILVLKYFKELKQDAPNIKEILS